MTGPLAPTTPAGGQGAAGPLHHTRQVDRLLRSDETYRMCDYWCRIGILAPVVKASGSGSRRRFTPTEAAVASRLGHLSRLVGRGESNLLRDAARALRSSRPGQPVTVWDDGIVALTVLGVGQ